MSPIREGETSEDEVKLGANFSFHLGLLKGFCFRFGSLLGSGHADIEREETAGHGEKFVFSGEIMMADVVPSQFGFHLATELVICFIVEISE